MKPNNHLVTYRSGNSCIQVDYNLAKRSDLKQVQNVKVIRDEDCVTQHKLLLCQINLRTQIRKQDKPPAKNRIWGSIEIQNSYRGQY